MQLSLAKKINVALAVFAIIFLTTTVLFFYYDEQELSENFVKQHLDSLALNYFDSVNTMMLTGTMANRHIIQEKIQSQKDIVEARILRTEAVTKTFGDGFEDQKATTTFERQGLAGTQAYDFIERDGKEMISFIKPIRASKDYRGTNCLACHQVNEGEVLGAVKITYDLSRVQSEIKKSITHAGLLQLIITVICFVLLSLTFRRLVLFRLNRLRRTIEDVEQNLDLSKDIKVHYNDELGAVSEALNKMMKRFKGSFIKVSDASDKLINSATQVDEISKLTREAVLEQKNGTDSVAAAINELDASANEVQQNTESAAQKSIAVNDHAQQGLTLVNGTKDGIYQLRDRVLENTSMITQLSSKTNEVGGVLEVINAIAEQTNLLALNAAIEAARAGEQGRGFAVVADEVRSLATRTRESIDEIQLTISALQEDAKGAVTSMEQVSEQAQEKAEDVANVSTLLVDITQQIQELDDLNSHISNAAKQQNLAADEINQNVVNISDVAEKSSQDAIRGKEISEELLALAYALNEQVAQFKL
ncbi:methyl-accepting chemotaxis protein [Thalassotalea sediminis]|uniref:methyl-accepting chemotaxis protein n=1 Tax=Thalassotalea sediminis TaxID=1759089 RepID=UPI002572D58C|nr:methyl-accepting chemotaxis protein [Thalassotalea sediminis]